MLSFKLYRSNIHILLKISVTVTVIVTLIVMITVAVTVTVFGILLFLVQNGWGTVRERSEFFFGMARERRGKNANGTGTVQERNNYCNFISIENSVFKCILSFF